MGIARRPAGVVREAARVAEDDRLSLGRRRAGSVRTSMADLRLAHQHLEQIADAIRPPRQTLYGRAGLPVLHQQPVGAHGVAHVGDVAPRVEVADAQHRLAHAGFDLGDLPREARGDVGRRLPGAGVIERPRQRSRGREPRGRPSPARAC